MRLTTLLLLLFLYSGIAFSQTTPTPKTMLWKITGNNLKQPCYLYGTMHSRDKRVYYLGDSVYSSMKSCTGFAMEIDPGEYVDTFINSIENEHLDISYRQAVESDLLQKKTDPYKNSSRQFDSLMIKMRERYNDISARDIARLRKAYRRRDRNDMRTALDLYLFDLAKRQGKIVGGIEDITDQTSLKDELGNPFDPDEFLKNQRKKYADVEEWMIDNYTKAELDNIHEFSKQSQSKEQFSLMLSNRNYKMSRRIDSLGKIRSTFCAVGAAHLPGDSGVINLLRKRGFTVTPVFSSKTIEPGDIKIDNQLQKLISISDADSNYIVQMPGKPTILTSITNKLYVKTYKELSNEILLMSGVYEDGNLAKTIDEEVAEMTRFFSRNDIKLYSSNKIVRQQLNGYDVNFKSREGFIRIQLFYNAGKTYMFAVGSKYKDSLGSARCENYINSYTMILNRPKPASNMLSFTCPDKAFSVSLPALPKKEIVAGDNTFTKEDVTLFSSVDTKAKINYLVLLKEPFKGYFFDFDSTIFVQTVNEIKKGIRQTDMSVENIILDGYPALKVKIRGEADDKNFVIYAALAIRHNRMYNLTTRSLITEDNEVLFDQFINSFRFLPYTATPFEKQAGGDNLFSVMAPSPVYYLRNNVYEQEKHKTTSVKRTDYFSVDSNTAMSYGITALGLGKYYWVEEEKKLLDDYARINFNDSLATDNVLNTDSLVYKKNVYNGGIEGRELLLKNLVNNSFVRLRIMHYADSVFILNLKGDQELVMNENTDLFFNSFRFINENFSSTAFTSKTALLISDLQSADSSICIGAAAALRKGFRFPKQDLPQLLDAFLFPYKTIKNNSTNQAALLAQTIAPYTGTTVFDFIKANYPALQGKREDIRMLMLNILSASNNAAAYQVLKTLLLNEPPPLAADYGIVLSNLSHSPAITASLFPDIAIKLKNDDLAPLIIDIANMLTDSNQLQYASLKNYEDDIIHAGKQLLKKYRAENNDNFYAPHTIGILQMLAKINQKTARAVLNDFIELGNYTLNSVIIVALLQNDQPVAGSVIDNFCSNPERRIQLYDALINVGRQSSFKGEYASQRSFAEAFATAYTNNEITADIPKYFDIAAIKDVMVNDTMRRFYVFKVTCQYRRSNEFYTCIIGPFSTVTTDLSIKAGEEKFILYRSKFDTNNIDKLFSDYIDKFKK
ncbi:TraB/GumN family protein [Ferruginibacter sp. SUN106]|uniref:TraB/GumN family protein n=1 Tax=Ferruginibacter sp. SUN106 TaxID=2978348 RepID=UPI003D35AC3C